VRKRSSSVPGVIEKRQLMAGHPPGIPTPNGALARDGNANGTEPIGQQLAVYEVRIERDSPVARRTITLVPTHGLKALISFVTWLRDRLTNYEIRAATAEKIIAEAAETLAQADVLEAKAEAIRECTREKKMERTMKQRRLIERLKRECL